MQSIQSPASAIHEVVSGPTDARETPELPFWREALNGSLAFVKTSTGRLTVALGAVVAFCFWPLFHQLPGVWFEEDSRYTHGILVPFIFAYLLYDQRETLKKIPIKGSWIGAVLLLPVLYVVFVASRTEMSGILSYLFICTVLLIVVTVAGWQMMWATCLRIGYLLFGLPFGQGFFNKLTNWLQILSTDTSYQMLKAANLSPYKIDNTQILVGDYNLYVAGACSGLNLTLSVTAFMVLFMLIGRLRWWANLILTASILPLAILVNGLRIALIGFVGQQWGGDAAAKFHDWSGYISILLCFFILMKLTRALGWKS